MERQKKYKVIGIMSGTSLDGLDLCCATFKKTAIGWRFKIDHSTTIKYRAAWKRNLADAIKLSVPDLLEMDVKFGRFIADQTNHFLARHKISNVDLIASHGHTVFHQPKRGFTLQIGSGYEIFLHTGLPVVNNFRGMDVAKGGQGAPLVPIGDELLFQEYAACLNIGGIANISFKKKSKRIAYDICFANIALNYLVNKSGKAFDKDGMLAESGKLNKKLYNDLNNSIKLNGKQSLSWEIFSEKMKPILDKENIPLPDRMHTTLSLAAIKIAEAINENIGNGNVLCTGGGVHNKFLMQQIKNNLKAGRQLILPNSQLIDHKEALIFGLLGLLRMRNETNCLSSVTGAKSDSSSGILYQP